MAIFFTGDNGIDGRELWVSDGTTQGTKMVKEINLGPDPYGSGDIWGNNPDKTNIIIVGEFQNRLYFTANDGIHGREMWMSDGTEIGTKLLKDINPSQTSEPVGMEGIVYNNKYYFTANDGVHGMELWATDGTTVGTHMVKDVNLQGDSSPLHFYEFNGRLYFSAFDSSGRELWVSDGTSLGTKMFANMNQDTAGYKGSDPQMFLEYHDKLYFNSSPTYPYSNQFFYIDGNDSNVNEIVLNIGVNWIPWERYVFHDKIFFSGFNADFGAEPYFTNDGFVTSQLIADIDTFMISPLSGQTQSSSPSHHFEFQDYLIFKARDRLGGGRQLWVYDDSNDTLQPLIPFSKHQIYNSANNFGSDFGVIVSGSSCFLVGEYDSSGVELWRMYDSTAVGIEENEANFSSNLKVYPNPNTGNSITLELNEIFEGTIQIEMLDFSGKSVRSMKYENTVNQTIQIPTKGLKQGVYFIKVSSKNYEETVKFVKL